MRHRAALAGLLLLVVGCPASFPLGNGGAEGGAGADAADRRDLAAPGDLASSRDLAAAVDLVVPEDLSPPRDLAGPRDLGSARDLASGADMAVQPNPNASVLCGPQACAAPRSICCRQGPWGPGTCVAPGEPCASKAWLCDDPTDCGAGEVCCGGAQGSACAPAAECRNRMGQRLCQDGMHCDRGEMCCGVGPSPDYFCGDLCPISQRHRKRDVRYLDGRDELRLHDELLRVPLTTFRYLDEPATVAPRLGFIIEDVAPSAAVLPSGERVDVYGYTSMAVAALKEQARRIEALEREVARLSRGSEPRSDRRRRARAR